MNRTHFEHIGIALLMQAVIGLSTGNWFAGAAFGAAFFVGREHTQAEYRWIEAYGWDYESGGHTRRMMPWWGGFDLRVWKKLDAWLDWMAPSVAVSVVAVAHGGL